MKSAPRRHGDTCPLCGCTAEIAAQEFARRIAERYGYTLPDLQGLGRQADRVAVRSLAACLLREAGFSLPIIARALRRNHSTVMHSLRKVSAAYAAGVETALPELPQRPEAEPAK